MKCDYLLLVLERDSKLNELDDRATSLQQGAEMFDRNAGKIQRKFWYQNMKMNFIIGGVVLVIIIIIIIVIVTSTKKDDPNPWKIHLPLCEATYDRLERTLSCQKSSLFWGRFWCDFRSSSFTSLFG